MSVKGARVIQVIETEALTGEGTEENPMWIKRQYWSLEGELLAESTMDMNEAREPAPWNPGGM